MPLITDRKQVLEVYTAAVDRRWVLPTFNSENLTTTEAILTATRDYGRTIGVEDLPIIIGITNKYKPRPQSVYYTHTRRWEIGMQLFLKELEVLTSGESPFSKLKVMVHLDHIQWDDDREFLDWDMGQFSSIMYDASTLPFDLNIEKTAIFREKHGDNILVEGACDVIGKTLNEEGGLTTPENAERYMRETGVDIVVANLGTEHRASAADLYYRSDLAKQVSKRLGKGCLCLHGASSVAPDSLSSLFEDGIRKVNIWTALERDSSVVLFTEMVKNAAKIIGRENTEKLITQGLLGKKIDPGNNASVDFCTTTYRQHIVFQEMQNIVLNYLSVFYNSKNEHE